MEHHANLVPWQRACARTGATLRWIPVTDEGRLDLDAADALITERTKVLAVTHASNVLGTLNPVAALAGKARSVGALTLLDACQSVPHAPVDVHALGVDLAVFSAHKMLGPNGLGALAGRREVLDALPPLVTGGSMVDEVTMTTATFKAPPARFESGTPAISQTVALHAAVRYLQSLGMDRVAAHEHDLTRRILAGLDGMAGVRVLGPVTPDERVGAVSIAVEASTRTTSARCSTPPAWRAGRPPLRAARAPALRRPVEHPGERVPVLDARRGRRLPRGAGRRPALLRAGLSHGLAARPAVPAGHPRPLPGEARPRAARPPADLRPGRRRRRAARVG
jgi:hypothetical protein